MANVQEIRKAAVEKVEKLARQAVEDGEARSIQAGRCLIYRRRPELAETIRTGEPPEQAVQKSERVQRAEAAMEKLKDTADVLRDKHGWSRAEAMVQACKLNPDLVKKARDRDDLHWASK